MKAIVLAAGEGTRMRPLTRRRPKPLLPVGDRALIEHVMDACVDHVDGFVVVVGYRGDDVRSRIGERYDGTPVEYVTQEEQKGTADAVEAAAPHVDEQMLVLNGDVLLDEALVERMSDVEANGVAVTRVDDPTAYGVVSVDDGAVTDLVEKPDDPPSQLANVGVYAFEPALFEYLGATETSERGERELTETIHRMLDGGHGFRAVEYDGTWLDVGRPWELLAANEHLLDAAERRLEGDVVEPEHIEGAVVVEEGASVAAGCTVEGPAVIRKGATIGPNAYVRGATVVGPEAHVGHGVEIKNSVLMDGATVGHLSYVGDSVLGADVNLGAGTVVANLRHDGEAVVMTVKGERVDTGRRKFGVVLGDGVSTGINTSLNAGVRIGIGATTAPGAVVTRDVPGEAESGSEST